MPLGAARHQHAGGVQNQRCVAPLRHVQNGQILLPQQLLFERHARRFVLQSGCRCGRRCARPGLQQHLALATAMDLGHQEKLRQVLGDGELDLGRRLPRGLQLGLEDAPNFRGFAGSQRG